MHYDMNDQATESLHGVHTHETDQVGSHQRNFCYVKF